MKKIHTFLVTAYLFGGLLLMAQASFGDVHALILNSGGATLAVETLHGAADQTTLSAEAAMAMESAAAAHQFVFGLLLFMFGGFVHAYAVLRSERSVHISVKEKKPERLFWLEMKI